MYKRQVWGGAEKVAAGLAEYYRDAATIKVHALNEPLPENGLYSNAMAGDVYKRQPIRTPGTAS